MSIQNLDASKQHAMLTLHCLMNQAQEAPAEKKGAAYYIVLRAMLLAHKNNHLLEVTCKRFLADCPKEGKEFETLRFRYQPEIAGVQPAKTKGSIRKGRAQRKREETSKRQVVHAAAAVLNAPA
jgi:hypothetical protein